MELSSKEIERVVAWAREVFTRTEVDWSIADDDLLARFQNELNGTDHQV